MSKNCQLLVCDCVKSMSVDEKNLLEISQSESVIKTTNLCGDEINILEKSLQNFDQVIVTCQQQSVQFNDVKDEINQHAGTNKNLKTIDIRDRAGWSFDGANENLINAKQGALFTEALLNQPLTPVRDLVSSGICLVIGETDIAVYVAERISSMLSVTCLLSDISDYIIPNANFDIAAGNLRSASGTIGNFAVVVDDYAPLNMGGRGSLKFGEFINGAKSSCDLIFDLTTQTSLFASPEKVDGYFKIDPTNNLEIEKKLFDLVQLIGSFEKPLYVKLNESLCAHSRASKIGCTKCIDVCPAGAIQAAGDFVNVSNDICAGCGSCAAVCPSGAISFDDPPFEFLLKRIQSLSETFQKTTNIPPQLLIYETEFGQELIMLFARYGRGLPPTMIPMSVAHIEGIGHTELLAAITTGFSDVLVLKSPKTNSLTINSELSIARAILEGTNQDPNRIRVIDPRDPDELDKFVYYPPSPPISTDAVLLLGGRRDITRISAQKLFESELSDHSEKSCNPIIALPKHSPYGEILVNSDACTLCLACASLCPTGAIGDHSDRPEINFTENACIQCGICASTCPEDAISLIPRLNTNKDVLTARVLNYEEPFNCISCNRPFGVKSTIERIVKQLEGKHWMYKNSDKTKLVKMCDDCRVNAQYHHENSPFKFGEKPRTRTTDDYLDS